MTTRLRVGVPPEVWDHIFEIATHVPYTLVPEIFEKSALIGDDYNELCRPALKTAFATKWNLVLVCKQWWHLAIRYLYRAILINNPRKILSICSTLQNYANGMGAVPGAKPLGWWAERLDVVIRGAAADEERLVDVIMCLPNLAVVSLDIRERRSKDELILRYILNALWHAASSLRVLDWVDGIVRSCYPAYREAVSRGAVPTVYLTFPIYAMDGRIHSPKHPVIPYHVCCEADAYHRGRHPRWEWAGG